MTQLKIVVFEKLKEAMRNKDTLSKGVLSILKSNLEAAEKEKKDILTKDEEIAVVQREVKQTKQALDGAVNAKREDLIEKETAKITLLETFLPKQLSEQEVTDILVNAGISKGMNMGEAMKIAKPLLNGKTENATISKVAKNLIS